MTYCHAALPMLMRYITFQWITTACAGDIPTTKRLFRDHLPLSIGQHRLVLALGGQNSATIFVRWTSKFIFWKVSSLGHIQTMTVTTFIEDGEVFISTTGKF